LPAACRRIGGERGIAVSRNIPEKQLQELVAIRDGIKVLENQLGKLDGPPRFL
jgi:hypothetical protein